MTISSSTETTDKHASMTAGTDMSVHVWKLALTCQYKHNSWHWHASTCMTAGTDMPVKYNNWHWHASTCMTAGTVYSGVTWQTHITGWIDTLCLIAAAAKR